MTVDSNFAFLDQISAEFIKRHRKSRIQNANAYGLDKNFKPTVRSAVHYHNTNHQSIAQEERVGKLLAKVEDMRRVMGVNINLALQRGEKFERLVQKSDELEEDAQIFKRKSARVKRIQQRKYYIKWAIMAAIVSVVGFTFLYVVLISFCGAKFQRCQRSDGPGQVAQDDAQQENENLFLRF